MAVQGSAVGIVIELEDRASKKMAAAGKSVGDLSKSLEASNSAGKEMATSFGSGASELGGFLKTMKAFGPVLKIALLPFKLLSKGLADAAELYDTLKMARGIFLSTEDAAYGLGKSMSELEASTGLAWEEAFALNKQLGGLGTTEEQLIETTKQAAGLIRAFKIPSEQALSFVRLSEAMTGTGEAADELGMETIALQKTFRLPELLQDLPEMANLARKGVLKLGGDFKSKASPTIEGVAKVTSVLTGRLGILGKEASKISQGMVGTFQDLSLNLSAVFTGVEDDFDTRTKSIMELFVRTGRGAQGAFDAIQKGAEGNFDDIAQSFVDVQNQGGIAAKRMRVLFIKQFGDELPTILENLGKTNVELKAQFEKHMPQGIKKATSFKQIQEKLLETTSNLVDRFQGLITGIGRGLGLSGNFGDVLTSLFGNLEKWGEKLGAFWNSLVVKTDQTIGQTIKNFYSGYIQPMLVEVGVGIDKVLMDWQKKVFGWIQGKALPVIQGFVDGIAAWFDRGITSAMEFWLVIQKGIGFVYDLGSVFKLTFDLIKTGARLVVLGLVGIIEKLVDVVAWLSETTGAFKESTAKAQKFMRTMREGVQDSIKGDAEAAGNTLKDIQERNEVIENLKRDIEHRKEMDRNRKAGGASGNINLSAKFSFEPVSLTGSIKAVEAQRSVDSKGGPQVMPATR